MDESALARTKMHLVAFSAGLGPTADDTLQVGAVDGNQGAVVFAIRRDHGGQFATRWAVPKTRMKFQVDRPAADDLFVTESIGGARLQAAAAQVQIDGRIVQGLLPDPQDLVGLA